MVIIFSIFVLISQMQCIYLLQKIPDMDSVRETVQSGFYIATTDHPKSGFYIMEIWKDVPGYLGMYQISNKCRARSLDRTILRSNGVNAKMKGKILKQGADKAGYFTVSLSDKNKVAKTKRIHRLMAENFIPNPDNLPEVNHKDGNKKNNSLDNLEWTNRSNNMLHAASIGLLKIGEQNNFSKLNEFQVRVIRKCDISSGIICKYFGVAGSTIRSLRRGESWKHIN